MPRGWTALCLLSLLREYEYRLRAAAAWFRRWEGGGSPRLSERLNGRAELRRGKGPLPNPRTDAHGCSRRGQRLTWEPKGVGGEGMATASR
ncbi:hypothetical protein P7K49_035881, partial [Saguinus oedipus]